MNKITINVTQEDIDKGISMNSEFCPVALAFKRTLPEMDAVHVNAFDVTLVKYEKRRRIFWRTKYESYIRRLPDKARKFIINFDSYNDKNLHKPFSFELEI